MSNVASSNSRRQHDGGWRRSVGIGFENAGLTYNTGNWVALMAALVAAFADGSGAHGYIASVGVALFGSAPALFVTAGSVAFFLGGSKYDRAHRDPRNPDWKTLNQGHSFSASGAILMAFGLVELSATNLGGCAALCGGALHAGGKIGSAFDDGRGVWKMLPLASRAFALVSLIADLGAAPGAARMLAAAILIICVAIWARADAMLLSVSQTRFVAALCGLRRDMGT